MTRIAEQDLLGRLRAACATPADGAPGRFDVQAWVAACLERGAWAEAELLPVLYKLGRKIEISHRLYRSYGEDLAKPAGTEPADAATVAALCGLFLAWASHHNDFRFVNTVLKIDRGILTAPQASLAPELRAWAETLAQSLAIAT
ncbi:MAG: hypothetical protein ACM3Q1_11980 [Bacteroidales bacterium]